MVKNLPAVQETLVWFLVREDPLEEGGATHSSVVAWRIPWTEESGLLQHHRSKVSILRRSAFFTEADTDLVGLEMDPESLHF